MPGMAMREFECTLCGQCFQMLAGDLILPGPELSDDCLRTVWALDDEGLERRVADAGPALAGDIRAYLQGYKRRFASVDDAIRSRSG